MILNDIIIVSILLKFDILLLNTQLLSFHNLILVFIWDIVFKLEINQEVNVIQWSNNEVVVPFFY